MKRSLVLALIFALLLTGCAGPQNIPSDTGADTDRPADTSVSGGETTALAAKVDFAKNDDEMFTDKDNDTSYDEDKTVRVTLSEGGAEVSSNAARVSGSTVTLLSEATYVISGKLDDGMIVVNAPDTAKVQIVLDGADITSKTSAALYVLEADKVFVTLAEGSTNSLANGGTFTAIDDNNINAALYSKCDITINGSGALSVTSPAGHGISGKDDLVITGGKYDIASASHGIDANDSIRITGADITVDAGKDGIHAENNDDETLGYVYISGGNFKIEAEGDGISGAASLQIEDGDFDIVTGGGAVNGEKKTSESFGGFMGGKPGGRPGQSSSSASSAEEDSESIKGIKSSGGLLISGGSFKIDSADDAVHSNANVTVNGGTFEILTGDDGFHADETLTITNGKIDIKQSYEALEALHVNITGGEISAVASDDGINAAGGNDQSGFGGVRGDQFGGGKGGFGPMGGMGSSSNGSINISGGNIYLQASGDGIDANGTLEISGGYTVVCGPTTGDTATLDYDNSALISGGTFIGTGARNMAQTFSDSEQGLISLSVGNKYAGTKITLTDADGNVLIEHTPALNYAIVIISSPDIVSNESYTLTLGKDSTEVTAE